MYVRNYISLKKLNFERKTNKISMKDFGRKSNIGERLKLITKNNKITIK